MIKFLVSFFLIFLSGVSYAESVIPLNEFGRLPILHEGRIKPLDSFARIELIKFAKRENPNGLIPLEWLARCIFDPATAVQDKIFLVENAETRHIMGLEERKKPFYSYTELLSGLEKTKSDTAHLINNLPDKLTREQQDLLSIHENALQYTQILRSFSSVLPLDVSLPLDWKKQAGLTDKNTVNFINLQKISPALEEKIKNIVTAKGEDPNKYNPTELELVMLGWKIKTIAEAGQNNNLFRIIPISGEGGFASPWELINDGKGGPKSQNILNNWVTLSHAWQTQDAGAWADAIDSINYHYLSALPENYDSGRIWVETIYNSISPFQISFLLFSLSFIFSILFFINHSQKIYRIGLFLLICAVISQSLGLVGRIYVMDRPPVGTLYESILFVTFIASLLSIFVERRIQNGIGLISGAVVGVILSLLAFSLVGEGDNMKVLGAVLNTRFWLTTHVLCITIGYGWCLLTSLLAHIALVRQSISRKREGDNDDHHLSHMITTHALFSLLFTTIGTILGGIWADQSWGRFWGWDPKENGALLIVLWLIWLIHGKIAGQISQMVWLGGISMLSVIVGIAWVGVNLLGVGLHSYGFIDGVFWGLGLFSALEIAIITTMVIIINKKKKVLNAV